MICRCFDESSNGLLDAGHHPIVVGSDTVLNLWVYRPFHRFFFPISFSSIFSRAIATTPIAFTVAASL